MERFDFHKEVVVARKVFVRKQRRREHSFEYSDIFSTSEDNPLFKTRRNV